ncbi:conjugal transfer protein [Nocardia sp. NPDC005978]|uniref:conjugal transfer protein n=1 Tax=Nocardia sp. NPDC005978 TaxID=3156725 RepID=UPI0033BC04D1
MRISNRRSLDSGDQLLRRMAVRRRREKVGLTLLATLAVVGGGHTILDVFASDPPAIVAEPAAVTVGQAQLVGAFAQQFVVEYLNTVAGQKDHLDAYVPAGQGIDLPAAAVQVRDPIVVFTSRAVTTNDLDVWAVTVSVRAGRAGTTGDIRLYFRVGVSAAQGQLRALALPSVVNPPQRGFDLELVYRSSCATGTPLGDVAMGFITAFLTGTGDVNRYAAVNSGITGLQPPPFAAIESTGVTTDDTTCGNSTSTAHVLITVKPKLGAAGFQPLSYPLTLDRTAGQWQVSTIDAIPALSMPLAVVDAQGFGAQPPSATTVPSLTSTVRVPPATQN